jgi:hypothetical protein
LSDFLQLSDAVETRILNGRGHCPTEFARHLRIARLAVQNATYRRVYGLPMDMIDARLLLEKGEACLPEAGR